jgi:hypothetical protein
VPDVLFACASTCFTMAVIFVVASFFSDNVTAGSAGRVLARFFAGTLVVSGLFLFALGYGLLRDERARVDHYSFPIALGIVIGGLEAFLFLLPAGQFLLAPLLLLIFAFRPVRRRVGRLVGAGAGPRR